MWTMKREWLKRLWGLKKNLKFKTVRFVFLSVPSEHLEPIEREMEREQVFESKERIGRGVVLSVHSAFWRAKPHTFHFPPIHSNLLPMKIEGD